MKRKLTTLLSVVILLALWQLVAMMVNQPEFMPSLPRLVTTFAGLLTEASFYLSVLITIGRGLLGMLISLFTAIILSGFFVRFRWLYDLFRPLLTVMRSVPVISFILIALIFLHPESIPILIGFLTMFPLLTENLTKGISSFRPQSDIMARQFQLSRRNRICHIFYPQLKPFLFSGLTSAAGFGWRAIIMGEVLSQCSLGIGSEMKKAQTFIEVPELLAWTLIAILISYISDKGIAWLSERSFSIAFPPAIKLRDKNAPVNEQIIQGQSITLNNVSYHYAISNFSYAFTAGKVYGISAPSGRGKTTLLNLINGTLSPTEGTIEINRERGISSLFQEPELLPHLSNIENVALPLARYYPREEAYIIAANILCHLEMNAINEDNPTQLSYGQQQRVALARALAYPSPYLLLDEPFKGLDEKLNERIIDYLVERQKERRQTILFTSHQSEELAQLADDILYL